jgi:hypothetical protein
MHTSQDIDRTDGLSNRCTATASVDHRTDETHRHCTSLTRHSTRRGRPRIDLQKATIIDVSLSSLPVPENVREDGEED